MGLTFPIDADGLIVDVRVNLSMIRLIPLWQAGVSPPGGQGRALIDTGADMTSVSAALLSRLGTTSSVSATTQGIGGSVSSGIHLVSLSIFDAADPNRPWIVRPTLPVSELPPTIPFDALIGLDIVRTTRLWVDGPGGVFTLDG